MRVVPLIVAALLIVAVLPLFAADTAVGSISSLSGTVEIDAFGKGAFIAAVRVDRIYDTTVIRTGPRSSATIELLGKLSQIPPDTTFRIADAMEGQRRTNRLGWFPALLGVLKDALASFGASGSDVVLGSKASETIPEGNEWIVEEDDPQEQLIDARKAVREGDWLHALNILDAIPGNAADALLPGEVSFLRGSAHFGLGDYASARMYLAKAEPLIRGSTDPEAAEILPVLLFQLGASRYFVGEDRPAAATLTSFVALDAGSPFAPYAYKLLLQALMAQGERARAQQVLAQAKVRFAGTVHEGEFTSLPPAP